MKKSNSGIMLVCGLGLAIVSGALGAVSAGNHDLDPSKDALYAAVEYGTMAGVVLGVALFAVGALKFSRG